MQGQTSSQRIVKFGVYQAHLATGELYRDGLRMRLPEQSFQVLARLLERPAELVTREELRRSLWPEDTFVDFDHGLNAAVNRLREALGDSAAEPRFIETLPRRGYRFIGSVESLTHPVVVGDPPPAARRRRRPWMLAAGGAALLMAVVLGLSFSRLRERLQGRPAAAEIKSLAVLPLQNLSGDSEQEYIADGMTEALINELSKISALKVISRTSAMHYKNTDKPMPLIARELGVDGLVEGSVAREGDQVRITVQLIHGRSDKHLWANSYQRESRDVLSLQSEVAHAIARQIEVAVTGQERSRLVAARAVAPEVYESYLKGRFALHKNSRAGHDEATVHFQAAIDRDATFAPAYEGLAAAHSRLGGVLLGVSPREARPKTIAAARKALELDPQLAEARVLLADALNREWHWAEAEAEYKRALELNPSSAAAHVGYAQWLLCQGRTQEALAWAERGRELDPLAPVGHGIGWILFHARRYDEAIRELRSVLAVEPENPLALWFLGFALTGAGRFDEAIQPLEKAASVTNRSSGVLGVLVRAYAGAGRRAEAVQLLEELHRRRQKGYVPPAAFVHAYLGLGDREQAFTWLERAAEERSNITLWVKVHPFFDPLRGDPRFQALVRRMNFPE
ncbi:MAG: tetratricopeptide repeat protein [bacterium]